MIYLAHTAHWQFLGLMLGCVGWLLTMVTAGINKWRLWHVSDASVVTSGVASVGIWRACFYSHTLPTLEVCREMGAADKFVPVEISVAQVLIMMAVVLGLAANIAASFAVRSVYFSVENRDHTRIVFSLAGSLYVLTVASLMVPLFWNMNSVLTNRTIEFPPEFQLPPAPFKQEVGAAIGLGLCASFFILASGLLFLCYRLPRGALEHTAQPIREDKESGLYASQPVTQIVSQRSTLQNRDVRVHHARDNPAFQTEEHL